MTEFELPTTGSVCLTEIFNSTHSISFTACYKLEICRKAPKICDEKGKKWNRWCNNYIRTSCVQHFKSRWTFLFPKICSCYPWWHGNQFSWWVITILYIVYWATAPSTTPWTNHWALEQVSLLWNYIQLNTFNIQTKTAKNTLYKTLCFCLCLSQNHFAVRN